MPNEKVDYQELLSVAAQVAGHQSIISGTQPEAIAAQSVAVALALIAAAKAATT